MVGRAVETMVWSRAASNIPSMIVPKTRLIWRRLRVGATAGAIAEVEDTESTVDPRRPPWTGPRSTARPPAFTRHGTAGRHLFTLPSHRGGMRVAIVTESFLPHVNGVTNTVRHTADRLLQRGHEVLIIAPGTGPATHGAATVTRVRSLPLPGYRSFPVGLPDATVERALERFAPHASTLAPRIMPGAVGLRAARRLGLPTVAVYQTDVGAFARQYGVRGLPVIEKWVARIHRRASRTLVPSTTSLRQLDAWGVPELHLWRRGVSLD